MIAKYGATTPKIASNAKTVFLRRLRNTKNVLARYTLICMMTQNPMTLYSKEFRASIINVASIPRAYGDEPKGVIIMESNSKITALLGLLMALPITLFWTGVSGICITLVCLVIFPSEYFLQATLLFTTLFFIVLNVNGWRELRR